MPVVDLRGSPRYRRPSEEITMTDQESTPRPGSPEPYGEERPEGARPDENQWSDAQAGGQAREWLGQLQAMIENLATQAVPVVREIGAKAAELAAVAGEKAGPIAAKAAEVTADAGTRFAERSRNLATELRRDAEADARRREPEGTSDAGESTAAGSSTGGVGGGSAS
jgi:hypothetical protein